MSENETPERTPENVSLEELLEDEDNRLLVGLLLVTGGLSDDQLRRWFGIFKKLEEKYGEELVLYALFGFISKGSTDHIPENQVDMNLEMVRGLVILLGSVGFGTLPRGQQEDR